MPVPDIPVPDMPLVSLDSSEIIDISYNGLELLYKVRIENPNSFEIPFPEIGWRFFLDGSSFIGGVIENNQNIKAGETAIAEVPVSLDYLEVFDSFESLWGRSQAEYKIEMAVDFPIPIPVIENWTCTLEHEWDIPLLQAPKLISPIMEVVNVGTAAVELYVSVNAENPNVFELPTPRLIFDYKVYGTSILRHRLNSRGPIAASSDMPIVFGMLIYYADLFRILPAVRNDSEVPGQLDLSIEFPVPAFNGESFDIRIPGTLPLTYR